MWGRDNKGRSLTTNDENRIFFRFELKKIDHQ
jgi:hypothetical protein